MKKVSTAEFLEKLTWVCEQAKFHGFYVIANLPPSAQTIDVTVPDTYSVKSRCIGKRHEFVFTKAAR